MAATNAPPRIPPRILSIAGSDSSGGAGIQADIKTITMLGGYAMTAITAVTAQNSTGVDAIEVLSRDLIDRQIAACVDDIGVDAVKIGMLGSPEIAKTLADRLQWLGVPIVFDPVMVATSGAILADDKTISGFRRLLGMATLVTPNLPELEALTAMPVSNKDEIFAAATALSDRHDCAVLAKGGHGTDGSVRDLLVTPRSRAVSFEHARIETRHTHGTGCTLSSAIATLLGHGQSTEHAIRLARQYVFKAIENAPGFGAGSGPLGHQAVRF
ncbi:bifunctional hydroxymethylpyrimidine kinase/phosphomethylpyrimidine kinase [Altererythrobacter aquiaggeris]|uniref:bifunctional hydroxymethylpyrimidine kinase/phosphomethylpyrimidine kinase n=1 Tax=Aestuarierythrobacter aquiaggeris TaxID=1898396 RepID=UPI003015E21C